jgi:ABC transporter with metal-binding/Fe-S-binding domain ATP-binding protein
MKTAVLFSGGKDSCLALYYAMKNSNVKCLITIISENPESYMFHTPNINFAKLQAEAIGLPIIIEKTKGEKETELKDLKNAIKIAIKKYKIQGIVTGAIESVYQSTRIQKICNRLKLECFNPLWQKDQFELLNELVKLKFEIIITGVFAEGLEHFIGRKIDNEFIEDIKKVHEKLKINPAGEGGEFESFVLNAPFFHRSLYIAKKKIYGSGKSYNMDVEVSLS